VVKEVLLTVAKEHRQVLKKPSPFVRLTDFADSALNFELHFYSSDFVTIENIKSDMRFEIDRLFRAEGIVIPFPQRDVWIKEGKQ